jgi:two-component system, OmpR family, KDP operon response regulator KdpE
VTRVLVVDDEPQILRALRINLRVRDYQVDVAATGTEALQMAARHPPDLVILDLGLPDLDGVEVIEGLRGWTKAPILVLSGRADSTDKVEALDAGADDYVTKPFHMGELLARIRVALRYAAKSDDEPLFTLGKLRVDLARHQVAIGESEVDLTPTEYEILKFLALHAGRIVTHRDLLRAIRGPQRNDVHYLRVYIAQLRHKIEEDPNRPRYIVTEPGVGYRFGAMH